MKTYRITNRMHGVTFDVLADCAQQACERCGWMPGDCHVRELGPAEPPVCPQCGGRGYTMTLGRAWPEPEPPDEIDCDMCHGTGVAEIEEV